MPPKRELEEARQQLVRVEASARELALELGQSGGDPAAINFFLDLKAAYDNEKNGWPIPKLVLRCSDALTLYDQYKDALVTLAKNDD